MPRVSLRKPASLRRIETQLESLDPETYRYHVLDTCRRFKNSWIELGQSLFSVQRDKLYREWKFLTFEDYCAKELGIKKPTAFKLIKSYSFLETEEPEYIRKSQEQAGEGDSGKFADLDSVNLLRLAKSSKKLEPPQYDRIRKKVLEDAQEPAEVRKELRMLSETSGKAPEEVRADRRIRFLKGLVRALEEARNEGIANKFLPAAVLGQLESLSEKVQKEILR